MTPTAPGASARRASSKTLKWRLGIVLLVSATLVLALWRPTPATFGPLAVLVAHSRPTPAPCVAAPTTATAARALTAVQLATRLRDAAHGDYRPADATSTFRTGQTAYLTFELATNSAGIATVLFCTAHERIRGTLSVPAGSANRYGQFSAVFARGNAGPGEAVLAWNGQAAAVAHFTVVPAQGS